jgi:hypothetical protein
MEESMMGADASPPSPVSVPVDTDGPAEASPPVGVPVITAYAERGRSNNSISTAIITTLRRKNDLTKYNS